MTTTSKLYTQSKQYCYTVSTITALLANIVHSTHQVNNSHTKKCLPKILYDTHIIFLFYFIKNHGGYFS